MSVKPILFKTDMVQAILNGRKTVTRRCVKPQHLRVLNSIYHREHPEVPDKALLEMLCEPPYQPGDILYVRETWADGHDGYVYKADDKLNWKVIKWHPSIHMPKKAARIWLKVTDVRVERLLCITEEQAIKEGFDPGSCQYEGAVWGQEDCDEWTAKTAFIALWDSTIPKKDINTYGWYANPWVWVIEFERCEKPEEGV